MSEGKRPPGPFSREHSPISSDEVIFRQTGEMGKVGGAAVPVCRPVALLYETMDEAECAEIIDLLNKGTHYDGMLEALKHMTEHYVRLASSGDAGFWDPEDEQVVQESRAAIEAAEAAQTAKG